MAERSWILVVEDDADIREVLYHLLASEGYDVVAVANGVQALETLRQSPVGVKLVLLDLLMPIMGGVDFLAEKVRDPALMDIPVVLMSAVDQLEAQTNTLPVDAVLAKPIDLEALLSTVSRYR